jgi:hypothetical protein
MTLTHNEKEVNKTIRTTLQKSFSCSRVYIDKRVFLNLVRIKFYNISQTHNFEDIYKKLSIQLLLTKNARLLKPKFVYTERYHTEIESLCIYYNI